MNNRVNYTLIGFFVLLSLSAILGFSYWMLQPSNEQETKRYNIYFDESVLGLNIDAPVKYRGISVGKVTHLRISPHNSEQVEVEVTILKSTPVKESTVARLTAQGITGLSYINLTLGANNAPELKKKEGESCPTIKTVPSFFENVEQSLGGLSVKLSNTLSGTENLLQDKNQKEITQILQNTTKVTAKLNKLLDDKTIQHLKNTSAHLDSFTQHLDNATLKIDKLVPNIDNLVSKSAAWEDSIAHSMDSMKESYVGITASMIEFKRAVASGEFNIKAISSDVIPTMNNTFIELQGLMVKLGTVIKQYDRSPSDILYKEEAVKKAPGEK